jgi:CHAT domain-containing protein
VFAEKARRMPEMTNAALKSAIEAIEALRPRFVGFVSACTGFPLELVGTPPLATRFALGRLAGPDLLSTSLLIARAALSDDAARPAILSVFLAEASDVPDQERLEGAAREVADLAGMLQQDTALQVSCNVATSADLEQFAAALAKAHLLHFAGHGFYDEHDPLASGLVFRGGRLAARDLPASLTGAPLIFGNACESASLAGSGAASIHGWSGLAASLITAGASNYVGSLWPVGDTSSQKLAVEFYQNLLQGEGVGEALRKARQACYHRDAGRDPTWAAFVLFGCPRNRYRHHSSVRASK